MDEQALVVLKAVAKTYSELRSLAVDMTVVSENEDRGHRNEQRSRAIYVAPNLVRIEAGRGTMATITVADGTNQHQYFGPAGHYVNFPLNGRLSLPGFFDAKGPSSGQNAFLFQQIAGHVEEASLEEAGTVQVKYAPADLAPPAGFPQPGPVRFHVDPRTYLVTRVDSDYTLRRPHDDRMESVNVVTIFANFAVNAPVAPTAFEFTRFPGAVDLAELAAGGVAPSGFSSSTRGRQRHESRHSKSMEADGTLVEQTQLTLDGVEFTLERRLKLSDNRQELRVTNRVSAAAGGEPHEWNATVPVTG